MHGTRDGQSELLHEVRDLVADGIDPDPVHLSRPQQFPPRSDVATSGFRTHPMSSLQHLELRVGAVQDLRADQVEVIEERDHLGILTLASAQGAPDETGADEDDVRPGGAVVELEDPVLVELMRLESTEHGQSRLWNAAVGSTQKSGSINSDARRRRSRRSSNVPSGRGVPAKRARRSAAVEMLVAR
ncbi:hypothetical protein [Curtobacterium sp. MCPF17_003]|uniref:hypothetical protein n=1 Tax=Curtobacterium sp. MCPF17_003 TaxID=2175637 RepID=UPI0011B6E108|nr:hypothetical protein [Curtobacterium sp. MCPF17_003]